MPLGPFGEILGTTGTLDALGPDASKYESRVVAPRNPKLVREKEPPLKMTPSQFMFQMSLDTGKKLANTHNMHLPKKQELLDMGETTYQKFTQVDIEEALFQPFPSEIFFMNCEPHETHEVNLLLRNNDKVPRLVKVTQADSPYFKIISPNNAGNKVAAGLSTTFVLQFTPDECRDYFHELICMTEREKFVVPVRCIGARAILDFPDDVRFPVSPVKHPGQRTLFVRNVGTREAKFSLTTCKPFSVSPENGILQINESCQVTVEYCPQYAGEHMEDLVVHYDTGEDVYVKLYGVSQDVSVRLDKQVVRIENTYVGLANQRVVTLNNRTDVMAHFRWTRFSTHLEQEMEREMMIQLLKMEEMTEMERFVDECNTDPTMKDKMSIVSRTFLNRKRMHENDRLLFEDDIIKVEPVEGEIWPNSSREITVTFRPSEAREYQRVAFCDVTGRESRLSLKISGLGVGPKIQFSFPCLDMGFIFIHSTHTYELVLANKGDIDAMYKIRPSGSDFSRCFEFTPDDGLINPGAHQAIHITFKSAILGDFNEDFCFMFDGCPDPVKVSFKGCVIGPTFHFDKPKLKFGNVSYGFTSSQQVILHNDSLVPMTFKLRIPGDGSGKPIQATDESAAESPRGHYMRQPAQEFEIVPATGTIQPMSGMKILVHLLSNCIRKYNLGMVVDVVDVGEEIMSLPVSARCIVPPITLATPVLQYNRCFLDYPYEKLVGLSNSTDLPAKYELLPQEIDDTTVIYYHSSEPKGIIDPYSTRQVPMTIRAGGREELEATAYFKIFGSDEPPQDVQVTCFGEGPVVHVHPEELDWGQIPVLVNNTRPVVLANESMIKGRFNAYMLRPDTVFSVKPSSGEIEPQQSLTIHVTACLNDCMRFEDKLRVDIVDSQPRIVPLMGIGQGSTVDAEPPMPHHLVLGPHFSQTPLNKVFKLTNKGRRHQQIVWSTEGYSYTKAVKQAMSANKPERIAAPVFSITPHRFDLSPGETIDVVLKGQVDVPQVVQERLLCHAIIGRKGGKELIKRVDVSVDFIAPILEFSGKTLHFCVNKKPDDFLELQTREISLRNVSGLPLSMYLKLKYPFQIPRSDGSESSDLDVSLGVGESCDLQVQFDPSYREDFHSRTIEEAITITYSEHPHVDYIHLIGEVNFPNLSFESNKVDFGCILNHTEVTRYLNMTNNSPMTVRYRWSFLVDDQPNIVFHREKKPTWSFEAESKMSASIVDAADKDQGTEKCSEVRESEEGEGDVEQSGVVPALVLSSDEIGQMSFSMDSGRPLTSDRQRPKGINPVLESLLEQDTEVIPLGIEEIFDVLPLYGEIAPGQTEQLTLTFFGHADIEAKVTAICEVEGGPVYSIGIQGEASYVEYSFNTVEIDYGKVPYDQLSSAEIMLYNSGKVGFAFNSKGVISLPPEEEGRGAPSQQPILIPASGFIEANSCQTITVKYLPGVPESFVRSFELQVAHFPANTITLRGVGTFPRISLDLPRLCESGSQYETLVSEVRRTTVDAKPAATDISATGLGESQGIPPSSRRPPHHHHHEHPGLTQSDSGGLSELEVQMEIERRVVSAFAEDMQTARQERIMMMSEQVTLNGEVSPTIPVVSEADSPKHGAKSPSKKSKKKKPKQKPILPDYVLDFGYVVLGHVRSHIVRATNTGWFPVSFWAEKTGLQDLGFNMILDRVKDLPGAPSHDTLDFVVNFDPRGANLPLGPVETFICLNLVGGPCIPVRLRAHVTMPDVGVNNELVEFGDVRCGECKVVTVQLHNPSPVRAEWSTLAAADSGSLGLDGEKRRNKKDDRFTPLHLRRQHRQKVEKTGPPSFEMIPDCGELKPGQKMNVQIKFMPLEEKSYEQRVALRVAQSSQRLLIFCRGIGLEPRLDFDSNLVHFGPSLPFSSGDEKIIVVKNPCSFPIEFYNLEFDKIYLEEEKILRQMSGYDEHNTLLLPPRSVGDKLPHELLDYYEEQVKKAEELERQRREAEDAARAEAEAAEGEGVSPRQGVAYLDEVQIEQAAIPLRTGDDAATTAVSRPDSEPGVGELEVTPVSMAIARYLRIDLTPEGKAARNRRGIALVVHGAPLSGKTGTAVMLAKRYEAALLTVDGVIIEAIANGNTAAGRRARELCAEAGRRAAEAAEAEEQAAQAAAPGEPVPAPGKKPGLSVEAVTAHTQGQVAGAAIAQSMVQSMVSNRKTSTVSGPAPHAKHPGKEHSSTTGAKPGQPGGSGAEATGSSQIPGSPPPLTAPIARRLSISASVSGEDSLMSTILPEDLIVELLSERLLLNDCHRGVVVDSLETLFSPNMATTSQAILKAFNNRRYIYFVTLKSDFNSLKEKEKREQDEKERLAREEEEIERQRLEDMDEDEYDALTEEEKRKVDEKRLQIKKERRQRELMEKMEKERREREEREAEERRLEEERAMKKKGKKGAQAQPDDKSKSQAAKSKDGKPMTRESSMVKSKDGPSTDRPESHATEKSDGKHEEKKKVKPVAEKRPKSEDPGKDGVPTDPAEEVKEPMKESDRLLLQRFKTFEAEFRTICDMISYWDRTTLTFRRPPTPSERSEMPPEDQAGAHVADKGGASAGKKGAKGKGKAAEKVDKNAPKEHHAPAHPEKTDSKDLGHHDDAAEGTEAGESSKLSDDSQGVPNLLIDCAAFEHGPSPQTATQRVMTADKLPSAEEVLDGLGLGEKGPPIPPPAAFAVIPFPAKRRPPAAEPSSINHYQFVASGPDDPNILVEKEEEEDKSTTPDRTKEDASPAKGKGRRSELAKEKAAEKSSRRVSGRKSQRRGSDTGSPTGAPTPVSDDGHRLGNFRWIVPGGGEVTLKLRFKSDELGQFDQTFNFEILGTRRRYQLYCRGVCSFPTISREPRVVFPHRKKNKGTNEIVNKKYILASETFEFGPLLAEKVREKVKEGRFPENIEKLTIQNTSPMEAEVSFCLLNDLKNETYSIEPSSMTMGPGESQELTVWAFPRGPGRYDDAIVCCVKENPEPIVFKIACDGVRPELELDKKVLHFDKVLLHRKDTKIIYLRNSTLLPVAWKLCGLESLGDDFSVSQDSGIVEAKTEFALNAYFRAMKPYKPNQKKSVRLEVYDLENIAGMVQVENIQVLAEAYDVALDMSFPKGADGGIDFGVTRVFEETKQIITLRNKGAYEIVYNFILEPVASAPPDAPSLFTITPQRGSLSAGEKAASVQIVYKSRGEIILKDQPILKCQIIEPSIVEGGEMIASIPIKLSVRSVFSKYIISPQADINFGAIIVQSKKTRQFTIENRGEFDFRFAITRMMKTKEREKDPSPVAAALPPHQQKQAQQQKPQEAALAGAQARLQVGMFTISPAGGAVPPNNAAIITVDCIAENAGKSDEELSIEITDRNPKENKYGIPYRLFAEASVPSINTTDISTIFEEHRICKNLNFYHMTHEFQTGGTYGEEENRFVFSNVIVGCQSKARFRVTNSQKVPCDVNFVIKQTHGRGSAKGAYDSFEVEPARTQIPPHSYTYATVAFIPNAMQAFTSVFEASIEGVTSNQPRGKSLSFELFGEGNLPRISIVKPTLRNKRGQPLCLFRKLLVGRKEVTPLILTNDGPLPSRVDIDLIDPDSAFSIRPSGNTQAVMNYGDKDGIRHPHTASLTVNIGDTATFDVLFQPTASQRCVGDIKLTVINNQYEDSIIQLVGEGYEDDISFENMPHFEVHLPEPKEEKKEHGGKETKETKEVKEAKEKEAEEVLEGDDDGSGSDEVSAAKNNCIHFGDCFIDEGKTLSFSLVNHSTLDFIRFAWPADHPQLKFSPCVGHLSPGQSKLMSVTFLADKPITISEKPVLCKLVKIILTLGENEKAVDWDDTKRTMKWVDIPETRTESGAARKRKVVEIEPEPAFTETMDSARTIDLLVSAVADYAKFSCTVERIKFKDTLMFQTRQYELPLTNSGDVALEYNWQVVMETPSTPSSTPRASSRASSAGGNSLVPDWATCPITIEPSSGSIQPGKSAKLIVKYSPLSLGDCEARLLCRIGHLEPGVEGPVVAVKGRSLQPFCHFELEDSDYLSGARRKPEMRGPGGTPPGNALDPTTRVIEINSVGVGTKISKRFSIVNPTNHGYDFVWMQEDIPDVKQMPAFRCLVTEGHVAGGRKYDLEFEFTPTRVGTMESFWKFVIPDQNITVPFLLVGEALEPRVTLDRSHFNYRSLLIGHEAVETVHVINPEDIPFAFSILEESRHAPGYVNSLHVEPMQGVVPARSKLPIQLYFTPKSEEEVNFNLICQVKRKVLPLTLNVKADGYTMRSELWLEDRVTRHKEEVTSKKPGEINFGEVEIKETMTRSMRIMNSGKFNFDFSWEIECPHRPEVVDMFRIEPANGAVLHDGQKVTCKLTFAPSARVILRHCRAVLHISNGPDYVVDLVGSAVLPGVHFSQHEYDFGPCFVYRQGMVVTTGKIDVSNSDRRPISVDCLYQQTPHLHHNFEATVIQPGQSVSMTLTFLPRAAIKYREVIEFEVNGMSRHSIVVTGHGTDMRVEVANPKHKVLKLGVLKAGENNKKTVPIVNKSLCPITFRLAITPGCIALQDASVFRVSPTGQEITLAAKGGTANVDVFFAPKYRIPQFTEEIFIESSAVTIPLLGVTGACHGYDIFFDMEAMAFGAVVKGSQISKRLVMSNKGDIGAKFKWNENSFGPDFSISPVDGYISSGMDVPFDINFAPNRICADVRYKNLKCSIEGWKPVTITLTGTCIAVTPVKETLHFNAVVRSKDTKQVQIVNRTNATWVLKPVIDGEYWSGAETLSVEPQQTRPYELIYRPLTMTTDGKKHQGSAFFALPDGSGLLYNLTGNAETPRPISKVARDIPCKTAYVEVLTVSNWLPKAQRFKVTRELVRPDKLDPGTTVKGIDYLDVPGDSKRDYKLHFYAHKEGQSLFKIMFTNEVTNEYQYYELLLRAGRPSCVGTIHLRTPVRQAIQHTVTLENPLTSAVTFQITCSLPEVHCPSVLQIPPQSEGSANIEFLPLRVGEHQGRLEFSCNELGLYAYDLDLEGGPAGLERALYFRSHIGSQQMQVAKFTNYAKTKVDFACKVDSAEFHCDKQVTAAPGVEVSIEVSYEPIKLGDTKATLTVTSAQAGDFIFPLHATGLLPKPQGPVTIKAGGTSNITFRNVFPQVTPYTFQVDNPAFHLTKSGDSIRAHKDFRIVIGFDGSEGGPVMAKLIITCARSAGGAAPLQWVYYLRGMPA